jgi:ankyrin repeat protein
VGRTGSDARGTGVQPLHMAAENGRIEVVRSLLAAEANLEAGRVYGGKTGVTPLHLAVTRRHCQVVRALLEAGATVNAVDSDGTTALHVAARGGFVDEAALLLEHGALTNAPTRCRQSEGGEGQKQGDGQQGVGQSFGQTALHYAVRYHHMELTRLLVNNGCDVNAAEKMLINMAVLRGRTSQGEGRYVRLYLNLVSECDEAFNNPVSGANLR